MTKNSPPCGLSREQRHGAAKSAIEAAYDHFRIDRQGNLVSGNTFDHHHWSVICCQAVLE